MKSVCAAVFGLAILSSAALAVTPEGVWLSQDGGTKVHLTHCGGKLCGTVVWLEKPIDGRTGKPKTDTLNPDTAKRSRPLLGLHVVRGLAPSGPNKWSGLIYNADDGNTYSAHMMPNGNTAKVQGCVLGFLCKTQNWKRAN